MPRIIRSALSEQDVHEIALFVACDNPDAAFRLIDRFDETLQMLAENPMGGRAREEFGSNIRSFPVGNYLLFYRPAKDGIELVRVFARSA